MSDCNACITYAQFSNFEWEWVTGLLLWHMADQFYPQNLCKFSMYTNDIKRYQQKKLIRVMKDSEHHVVHMPLNLKEDFSG